MVFFVEPSLLPTSRAVPSAIFLRADARMVRFTGAKLVFVAGCDSFRCLAHRAF